MKHLATKLLGLAAITLALGAFVSSGTAVACDKTDAAKATASSETGCAAYKAKAQTASAKNSSKVHKATYTAGAGCEAYRAAMADCPVTDKCCSGMTSAAIASAEFGYETKTAKSAVTLASSEAGCEAHKAKSATYAAGAGCEAHKAKTAAALASSEAGCEAHKAKSATYAAGAGCEAHKSAALADGESGCTMHKSAAFASACQRYEACSVKADLAHADGADLEFYEKEKKQDGLAISGVKLPVFYATDLNGKKVSSRDLVGQPTVLVLLATHCGHSYQSLPILTAAAEEFGPKGLRVVGLVVGSTPAKAKGWFQEEMNHQVWVTEDLGVADALQSHLVPTYVLVDAKGNVKTKLVGFKEGVEVKKNIPVLLVQAGTKESKKS